MDARDGRCKTIVGDEGSKDKQASTSGDCELVGDQRAGTKERHGAVRDDARGAGLSVHERGAGTGPAKLDRR